MKSGSIGFTEFAEALVEFDLRDSEDTLNDKQLQHVCYVYILRYIYIYMCVCVD